MFCANKKTKNIALIQAFKEGDSMKEILHNRNPFFLTLFVAILLVIYPVHTAFAFSEEEMLERFRKMEEMLLKQQKQIQEQQKTIESLKKEIHVGKAADAPSGAPQNVSESEELKQAVASVIEESNLIPGWLKGLEYGGDLRLRYEGIYNRDDRDDRHRGRFRLRLSFAKKLSDELDVVFRLASASGSSITSSNQSFDDAFTKKGIWIDRVYAAFSPKAIPGLELAGGKLKNPFVHTDIVWALM
jgi:hypothetical protein